MTILEAGSRDRPLQRAWLAGLALVMTVATSWVPPSLAVPSDPPTESLEIVEEHWPNGQLRLRKQVIRLPDGTVVDHGNFERWHDNGHREYEAVFVYGKKEGTTVRYHKNGRQAARQEYRDGKRHGASISWDMNGVKVKEEGWADGQPHGTWTIWKNGKVEWSHTYVHGDPEPERSLMKGRQP